MLRRVLHALPLLFGSLAPACAGSKENAGTGASSGDGAQTTGAPSTTMTGSGGAGQGGATGGGGKTSCTPITMGAKVSVDTQPGGSSLVFDVKGLAANHTHIVYLEFYDVAGPQQAGAFDLSKAPDDNYKTCVHCLLAYESFETSAPTAYFPTKGAMTVTTPDTAFSGSSAGSLKNVELHEVTVKGGTTTPVANGRCLSLAAATWNTTGK